SGRLSTTEPGPPASATRASRLRSGEDLESDHDKVPPTIRATARNTPDEANNSPAGIDSVLPVQDPPGEEVAADSEHNPGNDHLNPQRIVDQQPKERRRKKKQDQGNHRRQEPQDNAGDTTVCAYDANLPFDLETFTDHGS